jgi:hypothetical protein
MSKLALFTVLLDHSLPVVTGKILDVQTSGGNTDSTEFYEGLKGSDLLVQVTIGQTCEWKA